MNLIKSSLSLGLAAVVVTACASGGGVAWTYAPLGPTPLVGASGAQSPGGSPATSPGTSPGASAGASPGLAIDVATEQATPLAFTPNALNAPAASAVTVNYNNNSNLPHNIHFFAGADSSAPSLGATEIVTGPNAPRSVTFTTPDQPGDYFFWCDVHTTGMTGTLHVQ